MVNQPGKHFLIVFILIVYFAAIFYIAPIFKPELLEPAAGNTALYFAITYVTATFCTFFSRLFYVTDVSIGFDMAAGLAVAFLFFVLIGQPRLKPQLLPDRGHLALVDLTPIDRRSANPILDVPPAIAPPRSPALAAHRAVPPRSTFSQNRPGPGGSGRDRRACYWPCRRPG